MSRTTWRALRTELLRSVAPVTALATLFAGAAMLYSDASSWAGQWTPFAAAVRSGMFLTGALAVAAGAWQTGRERRRRITEQLDATPRPVWQPVLVAWASVTLGCWLGLLIAVGAGALLVARVATYSGGGWWWLIVVGLIALAALAALGVALGRLIPYRLTGPTAAIAFYTLMIYAHDDGDAIGDAAWLAPIVRIYESFGGTLPLGFHVQQIVWFGGLAAVFLVLAAARRRAYALIPATVAIAGAVLLTTPPVQATEPFAASKWEPDPAARELVCTDDELVCLPRAEAFMLDDVAPYAREVLDRFDGVQGGPTRALNDYDPSTSDDEQLDLNTWPSVTGDLEPDETWMIVHWYPQFNCGEGVEEDYFRLAELAAKWAVDDPWGEPETQQALSTLRAMPEADQKGWIGDLIAAADTCDTESLESLREQLS